MRPQSVPWGPACQVLVRALSYAFTVRAVFGAGTSPRNGLTSLRCGGASGAGFGLTIISRVALAGARLLVWVFAAGAGDWDIRSATRVTVRSMAGSV